MSTAPRMLIEALVTSPAKSSVVPNASTIGHAVGAGISRVIARLPRVFASAVFIRGASTSDYVDHREDDDPDRVDEVPIERQRVEPFRVPLAHLSAERE